MDVLLAARTRNDQKEALHFDMQISCSPVGSLNLSLNLVPKITGQGRCGPLRP